MGFIFGSVAICSLGFTWLFVPECKGKSLEQIDLMFNEGVPLRKFGSYQAIDVNIEIGVAGIGKTSSSQAGAQ